MARKAHTSRLAAPSRPASVVRVWAFLDVGRGGALGSSFQYWDAAARSVAVNTTALARLDYMLMRAASLGLRLILTLTNNWWV